VSAAAGDLLGFLAAQVAGRRAGFRLADQVQQRSAFHVGAQGIGLGHHQTPILVLRL
jgi:hypothetical protein